MTINVCTVNIPDTEVLRTLIAESLPSVIKGCSIIDAEVPLPGMPILVLNSDNQALFVFFDHNAQNALMTGLSSMKHIKKQHRLINRLYPQLDITESATLIIMTAATIQGDYSYFKNDGSILFYTFRGISVNDEIALLIEPSEFNDNIEKTSYEAEDIEHKFIEKLEASLLTEDESRFFNDL